jgi:penicillin-binding protein 2
MQVIDKSNRISADNNALRYLTEFPARGLVYDRKGRPLLYNEAAYDLMVVPNQIKKDFDTLRLCGLIKMDHLTLRKKIVAAKKYSGFLPSIILDKLSKESYGIIQEQLADFPGFYMQARTIRNYPQSNGAQILGYISEVTGEIVKENSYYKPGDYIGMSGLEKFYEEDLRGVKGVRVIMVDVNNREMGSYLNGKLDEKAKAGKDLYTYIDIDLQSYAEKLLQYKRGSVVAIDPTTGGIIAIASSPTYDPNLLVGAERTANYVKLINDKNLPLFNRAMSGRYPPGSTFKTVIGLVGLQEGVLNTSIAYPCNGGFPLGHGKMVKCHSHYSPIALKGAIQNSCNAYFCRVLKTILENKKYKSTVEGFNVWRKYMVAFGFGNKLGVDLPSESSGNIPTAEYYDRFYGKGRWRAMSIISIGIGQGEILLTPLQMANQVAIIANKGYYYTPHIVRAIGDSANMNAKYLEKHIVPIKTEYFNYIIDGMLGVVEGGTATNVRMDSLRVCGKTGTVQNAGKNHSVFVAFAPMDHPRIAIAAVVENSGYGATYAAPIASLIIEKYLTSKITRPDLEKQIMESKLIDTK